MRKQIKGRSPPKSPAEATSSESTSPSELEIQQKIVAYLDENIITPFTATLGGVHASVSQRAKSRKLGYKKGVPDIIVFVPNCKYHGLCIEVKTKRGRITEDQRKWHYALESKGYFVCVPRSFEEAKQFIEQYMAIQ